jgi:nitronate monooxygenase
MDALRRLAAGLRLPLIGAPMRRLSGPDLVLAQCLGGIVGVFPATNARPANLLDEWISRIETGLQTAADMGTVRPPGPFGVQISIHAESMRWEADLFACGRHRVPLIFGTRQPSDKAVRMVHDWGGLMLHDVANTRQAEMALQAGVDGLVLITSGGAGRGGEINPLAMVNEIRGFYDGPLVLSGCVGRGKDILAAQVLGCDLAHMGTRFITAEESLASIAHRRMVLDASAADVIETAYLAGKPTRYLIASLEAAGLTPTMLPSTPNGMPSHQRPAAWQNVCRAGQGVGSIQESLSVGELLDQLEAEYLAARVAVGGY